MSDEIEDTIQQDVSDEIETAVAHDEDDQWTDEGGAEDAFLKSLRKDAPAEGDEEDEDRPEDAPPAKAEKTAEVAETIAGDDAKVDVKVGDETHRVTVAELKRLFGQEASLTQKGQEVAAARTEALAQAERAKVVVGKALEKAEERFNQYKDLDFWSLSKRMSDESFAQLRKDAQAAHDEFAYLSAEQGAVAQAATQLSEAAQRDAANRAVAELTNPKSASHIEGWSGQVYQDLMVFAESKGLKSARQIVDPTVVKLLHMAHQYEKGRTLATTKVTAAAKQPAKPLRSGSSNASAPARREGDSAFDRLRKTGRPADAEAAFMARMRRDDA